MRRREFISMLGGVAVWPLAARAQQATPFRVEVISPCALADRQPSLGAFRDGMRERGYQEGRNVSIYCTMAAGNVR